MIESALAKDKGLSLIRIPLFFVMHSLFERVAVAMVNRPDKMYSYVFVGG